MKIALYILLGIIALIALIAAGFFVYVKFFEGPKEAVSELAPQGLFDEQVVGHITQYAKDLREDTHLLDSTKSFIKSKDP